MINFVKTISTSIDSTKRRVVKFLRYGLNDIQETEEANAFGIDSNPVKDLVAIYAATNERGQNVIIGYINKNQLAEVGEFRTYSTDSSGAVKFYTWLKNDGTMELGGNANHLARFEELKTGFDKLVQDHNDLVTAFNTHMHPTAGTGAPSPPTPGSGIPAQPSTAEVDGSKITEIKTL